MLKLNSEVMLLHKLSNDSAYRAMFTAILKNIWNTMCRQTCSVKCEAYFTEMAFDLSS